MKQTATITITHDPDTDEELTVSSAFDPPVNTNEPNVVVALAEVAVGAIAVACSGESRHTGAL